MESFNLFDGELDDERTEPAGFTWRRAIVGAKLGAEKLGASLYELQPGEKSFPYHYEYGAEEWLLVVAGRPTLRTPDGEHELRNGDVVVFREGPAGAHQVRNDEAAAGRGGLPGQWQGRALDREGGRFTALPDRLRRRLLGRRGLETQRPRLRTGSLRGYALPLRRGNAWAYATSVGSAAAGGHPRSRVRAIPGTASGS